MILTFENLLLQAQTQGINQVLFMSCLQIFFGNSLCLSKKKLIPWYSMTQGLRKCETVCSRSFGYSFWQNWQKFNKNILLQKKNNFNSVGNFSFKEELFRSALPYHETGSDCSTIDKVAKFCNETACCTTHSNQGIKKAFWLAFFRLRYH